MSRVVVETHPDGVSLRFASLECDITCHGQTLGEAVRSLMGKILQIRDDSVEELARVGINIRFEGDDDVAPEEMPS